MVAVVMVTPALFRPTMPQGGNACSDWFLLDKGGTSSFLCLFLIGGSSYQ